MLTNPESLQVQIARFEQQLAEAIEQSHKLTVKRVQLQRRLIDMERKHEALVKQQFHLKEIIALLREQEKNNPAEQLAEPDLLHNRRGV